MATYLDIHDIPVDDGRPGDEASAPPLPAPAQDPLPARDAEPDEEWSAPGKKKGKKASQADGNSATSSLVPESKFHLPLGVIEELSRIGVEPPMGQGDVPEVVKKIKDKVENWKKDQDRKTKEVRNLFSDTLLY